MLAKFILVRPVPPLFKFFEFQAAALYLRMKKYMSNPKKIVRYARKFYFIVSDSSVTKVMHISDNFICRVRMM